MSRENQPGELDLGGSSLLDWLPGETFYGLCARQHAFWGNAHASTTAQVLFGGRRAGFQHDFPSHLAAFAQRTREALGTGRAIAENRTLLRYFRPFLSAEAHANAVAAMLSSSVAHLKFKLGLLTSRFRANHPLKGCRECIKEDPQETGWASWHLEHQFPGVWICMRHGTLLCESALKSTGVSRFDWVLPSRSSGWLPDARPTEAEYLRWRSLSELTLGVVNATRVVGWLPIESIRNTLLRELRERGMVTASGRARLQAIAAEFLEYSRAFAKLRELKELPSDQAAAEVQLGRLLRPMRSGTHPLRFLTLIDWLFAGFEAFHAALEAGSNEVEGQEELEKGMDPSDGVRSQVLSRIQAGEAPSSVARAVGVDVATARAWAAQAGISTASRPKVLRGDRLRGLVRDLESGLEKAAIARKHSVAVSTINRILRTTVGLQSKWMTAREGRERQSRRVQWSKGLNNYPALGPKLLRASMPAVYAWLYRNDRAWLEEHLPMRSQGRVANKTPWDERDLALRKAVHEALLKLAEQRPDRPIHLWQIYQLVPELKAKGQKLDRLPLTRRLLERTVGRRRPRNQSD